MTDDRTERPLENIVMRIRHWWHGCARFNRRWPHWQKDKTPGAKYAICSLCRARSWWMWGYKHLQPDHIAQFVQGARQDATDRYWSKHDGHA